MNNLLHYEKFVSRLKKDAQKSLQYGRYNRALSAISFCAQVMYTANQVYTDSRLEDLLEQVSHTCLPDPVPTHTPDNQRILFYDGFGLNNRGLIQIYLKALCRIGHIIYVTDQSKATQLPDVLNILHSASADVIFLKEDLYLSRMTELYRIFLEYAPGIAFLYTTPDDVSAIAVFDRYGTLATRYQINLSDHAFWLGVRAFDYCLEFRDYGASLSLHYRGIPKHKLIKLPFYPSVDPLAPFQGYPFICTQETKVVFSGGSLYKTLGGGGKFYQIVSYILEQYPESIFWYAGGGDKTKINKLISKFPNRVFITAERKDLFQVLQHCFLYLSTYPLCGGLMFQYAASAGKIPVTLKYDNVSDDFLLNQSQLGIEFSSIDDVKAEIHRLFTDETYKKQKEALVKNSVLNEESFYEALHVILSEGRPVYPINPKQIDTIAFRKEYLALLTRSKIYASFISPKNIPILIAYFPDILIFGVFAKIKQKIKSILNL